MKKEKSMNDQGYSRIGIFAGEKVVFNSGMYCYYGNCGLCIWY